MRDVLDGEGDKRPAPFGLVAIEHQYTPAEIEASRNGPGVDLTQAARMSPMVLLGPFFIWSMIALMGMSVWLVYRTLVLDIAAGMPVYYVVGAFLLNVGAGAIVWFLRDRRRMLPVVIGQIIVGSAVSTLALLGSSDNVRFIAVAAGVVTVANGFKVLSELKPKLEAAQ